MVNLVITPNSVFFAGYCSYLPVPTSTKKIIAQHHGKLIALHNNGIYITSLLLLLSSHPSLPSCPCWSSLLPIHYTIYDGAKKYVWIINNHYWWVVIPDHPSAPTDHIPTRFPWGFISCRNYYIVPQTAPRPNKNKNIENQSSEQSVGRYLGM